MEEIDYYKNIDIILKKLKDLKFTEKIYNSPKRYRTNYYNNNRERIIKKSLECYKNKRQERLEKMREYNKTYWNSRKKINVIVVPKKLETKPKEPLKTIISNNNLIVEF